MKLTYQQIPYGWAFCFLNQCARKDECLRYRAGLTIPDDCDTANAVTPTVLKGGTCPLYRKMETIRVAVGFEHIFHDVKARHAPYLRSKITDYLGGNGTYYRYLHGERALTPEQQEWICDLFREYGYNENIVFDAYEERFRFYDD